MDIWLPLSVDVMGSVLSEVNSGECTMAALQADARMHTGNFVSSTHGYAEDCLQLDVASTCHFSPYANDH